MRECDFKNYATDFKNMLIKLNRMYDVKALSPRQKLKLSIIFNSRVPVKHVKNNGLCIYADMDSVTQVQR